jgi:hypothetical protein
MRTRFYAGVAFAFCACVTGCAVPGASPVTTAAVTANALSARIAKDAITIGKSTKADVIAALGKTTVISFDSGFEVWVYRATGDTPAKLKTEFVVLFAPSGVVTKTRIRPAPFD